MSDEAFAGLVNDLQADHAEIKRLRRKHGVRHVGDKPPEDAELGEGWFDTKRQNVYYLDPNGSWYLKPPSKQVIDAYRKAETEAMTQTEPSENEQSLYERMSKLSKQTADDIDGPLGSAPEPEMEIVEETDDYVDIAMETQVVDKEGKDMPEETVTEDAAPEWELDPRQMMPDLRDRILQMFKDRRDAWHKMSEDEQRDVVVAVEDMALSAIRSVAETIASQGENSIRCQLESYTEKDGIKVAMKVAEFGDEITRAVLFLHEARGAHVMIRKANVDDYSGDREAEVDRDSPEIDFDAEPNPDILSDGDDSDLAGEDDAETEDQG